MVDIDKQEINQEINQEVNKVTLSKGVVNKQYDTLELLKLTFDILNKNKKKVLDFFAKLLLALIIVLIPTFIMFATLGLFETDIYNLHNKSREFMSDVGALFSLGLALAIVLTMFLFVLYAFVINWFQLKGVVSIDTGIQSIESKKVTVPVGSALTKVVAIQILAGVISIPFSVMVNMSGFMTPLYFLIIIQVYVIMFIFGSCVQFTYFEVLAKGKDLLSSFKNAVTNFLFSKNDIIVKSIAGNLLIGVISSVVLVVMMLFSVFLVMIFILTEVYVVAVVLGVTLTILFFLFIGYLAFFGTTYSYLLYMLNEVRDDKVDKLL